MNEQTLGWDDLRFVLAVARAGSMSAAAPALKVSHPTVFRRINRIEDRLGVRLFERHRSGYTPTQAGEEVLSVARRLEGEVTAVERRLQGQDLRPSGTVRVTTTDTLLIGFLSGLFAEFRRAHAEIDLEIAISNELFNISRRDADVAIRPSRDVPESLVGRRIGRIAMAVYGQPEVAGKETHVRDLDAVPWVGPDQSLSYLPVSAWLRERGFDRRVVYRVNSLLACCDAIRNGIGVGVLPCYLGDRQPDLVRVAPPVDWLTSELWLLTHPDLRRTARIRVFLDFMAENLRTYRRLFEGAGGASRND